MLFRLVAKLGIDSTEFTAGLKKAESGVDGMAKKMAAAFSAAAILAFIKSAADLAGEISDLSDELNISTDQVQQLKRAALESGVAFDKFAAALTRVRKAKNEALHGDKTAEKAFSRMGINPNQDDFELFKQVAASGTPEAMDMLGKGAMRLVGAVATLHDLGPIEMISQENARILDGSLDTLAKIWEIMKAITANTIVTPAGWMSAMADEFGGGFTKGFGMDKTENKGFLRTAGSVSNGIIEGILSMLDVNNNAARERNKFVNNPAPGLPEIMTTQELDDYIAELDGDVATLGRMGSSKKSKSASRLPKIDQERLTAIGGGLGGSNAVMNIQKEQLNSMREMNRKISRIADKIESVETE